MSVFLIARASSTVLPLTSTTRIRIVHSCVSHAARCGGPDFPLAKEPKSFRGHSLIDEDFLRDEGVTDFTRYRCDPAHEPEKIGFDFKVVAGRA